MNFAPDESLKHVDLNEGRLRVDVHMIKTTQRVMHDIVQIPEAYHSHGFRAKAAWEIHERVSEIFAMLNMLI